MTEQAKPTKGLPFWQRILITIVAMLIASFLFGQIWQALFNTNIPSYVAGIIGGLFALPIWEALKRMRIDVSRR